MGMGRAFLSFKSLDRVRKYPKFFDKLVQTRQSLHIGCGPGCDALGVLAFLTHCNEKTGVDRIVLMDYAMSQWKKLVLDALIPLVSPGYVVKVETASADVRLPFHNGMNTNFYKSLDISEIDLVVVSYLLTEIQPVSEKLIKPKWQDFFDDFFQKIKPNTLFLMSEPTAWQLHIFLKAYQDRIASHKWLDSSEDHLELQVLEGRMGPAVLIICTR